MNTEGLSCTKSHNLLANCHMKMCTGSRGGDGGGAVHSNAGHHGGFGAEPAHDAPLRPPRHVHAACAIRLLGEALHAGCVKSWEVFTYLRMLACGLVRVFQSISMSLHAGWSK